MTTLREKLTAAAISEQAQLAHLESGFLAVGGQRVTDLDTEIPEGSRDYGVYPWPELDPAERAAIEAQVLATRTARAEDERKKKEPTGW